jgi:hypothetical protein
MLSLDVDGYPDCDASSETDTHQANGSGSRET